MKRLTWAWVLGFAVVMVSTMAATLPNETALSGAPASNDLIRMVDVSDTTQSASGTTKKMTVANLFTSPTISARVSAAGVALSDTATAPAQASGDTVGTAVNITASNAVSGSSTHAGARGGAVNITAGRAITSMYGGDIVLTPGIGVGGYSSGQVVIGAAPDTSYSGIHGIAWEDSPGLKGPWDFRYNPNTYALVFTSNGSDIISLGTDSSVTGYGWKYQSNGGTYWVSNGASDTGTADTGLSRISAGVIGCGTGAVGSYAGSCKATQFLTDSTITAGGTTGAQTINKALLTVNFAAAATSLVVTDSLVTTSSIIHCDIRTNDATASLKNVVPASGSFTITMNAAVTAETSVGCEVKN